MRIDVFSFLFHGKKNIAWRITSALETGNASDKANKLTDDERSACSLSSRRHLSKPSKRLRPSIARGTDAVVERDLIPARPWVGVLRRTTEVPSDTARYDAKSEEIIRVEARERERDVLLSVG